MLSPTRFAWIALTLLALAPLPARPVRAQPVPVPPVPSYPYIQPASPCAGESVFVVVEGFRGGEPCTQFLGAGIGPSGGIEVRVRVREQFNCFAGPTEFFPVRILLGRFSAGHYQLVVRYVTERERPDSTVTISYVDHTLPFDVSQSCPPPPGNGSLPFLEIVESDPSPACAGNPVSLVLAGDFPNGCFSLTGAKLVSPSQVELTIQTGPGGTCPTVLVPWKARFALGALPAGPYVVHVVMHYLGFNKAPSDSGAVGVGGGGGSSGGGYQGPGDYGGDVVLNVQARCDSSSPPPPPPPPYGLPFVNVLEVGDAAHCGAYYCVQESIPVRVRGTFPSDCYRLKRVDLIHYPSFAPAPPTVRFVIDDGGCLGRPCSLREVPWEAAIQIPPPQVSGDQPVRVELAIVSCSDSIAPGQLFSTFMPLHVSESCTDPAGGGCFTADFVHRSDAACDASVTSGVEGSVIFGVRSPVALSGLQGVLRVDGGVRIAGLAPIGAAAGMSLQWGRQADGVHFVLFAPSGTPIGFRGPTEPVLPILEVRVAVDSTISILPVFPGGGPGTSVTLLATDLLGSDGRGLALRMCAPPPCVDRMLPGPYARICLEEPCDFNADGALDVRDLVLMAHCVLGEGDCPDSAVRRLDCDRNGRLELDDVLCCARQVLLGSSCAGCVADSGVVQPEAGMALTLGAPSQNGSSLEVALRLTGTAQLGAARLRFSLPATGPQVTAVEFVQPQPDWLLLHQQSGGEFQIGMVRLQPADPGRSNLDLRIRMTLREGQEASGMLQALDYQLLTPNGARLQAELGHPGVSLGSRPRLEFSANRPNPFHARTTFELRLDRIADVRVAVFDVVGREVKVLFDGSLQAGARTLTWDGTRADGSPASSGVYFYRARSRGVEISRKMILVRGE